MDMYDKIFNSGHDDQYIDYLLSKITINTDKCYCTTNVVCTCCMKGY